MLRELDPRVCNVDSRCQDWNARGAHLNNFALNERQNHIQIVNHQIKDDIDVYLQEDIMNSPNPARPLFIFLFVILCAGVLLAQNPVPLINQPLVLTPSAPGGPSKEIETLMLADRAPADYAAPAAATAGGFYLQLGAYARAENADAVRGKLASKLAGLEVVQGGSVFRLFSGPFATRQEAQQAAQGLPSSLGLRPIVVQR